MLFAPTSLSITTDFPPEYGPLVEWDANGDLKRINLPDHLVVMANHQVHFDWIYLWILACYAGRAEGVIIILKYTLRNIPLVGWGMVRDCQDQADDLALLRLHLLEALMGGG